MRNPVESPPVDIRFEPDAHEEDVWGYYAALRPHGPVFCAAEQRSFVVQSHALADAVLRSRDFITDHPFRRSRLAFGQTLIDMDGQAHRKQRQFVGGELVGRGLRDIIAATVFPAVDDLVGGVVRDGAADFHRDYAVPLPWRVACRLVGIEESAAVRLEPAVVALTRFLDDSTLTVADLLQRREDIEGHTRERLHVATQGLLARAREEIARGALVEEDVIRATTVMLSAATQTTVGALGLMMRTLVTHPEWQEALREGRSTVADFVREVLRWEPPLHLVLRFASRPTRLGDHDVPAGAAVQVNLGAANRDPDAFPNPDTFDPARQGRADLTFGRGAHTCPGSQLATAELELTLQGFLGATEWIDAERVPPITGKNFRVAHGLALLNQRTENR